jgi:hypothetical protein
MISIISLVLSLLQTALDAATSNKVADEVIAGIQAAIAALQKVQGSDVTYQQLEDLRIKPTW